MQQLQDKLQDVCLAIQRRAAPPAPTPACPSVKNLSRPLPAAPWSQKGGPPLTPCRMGCEKYFMVPYPSPAVQRGRRKTRPPGGWYEGTDIYPLAEHWTQSPEETWPEELQNFSYQLFCQDEQRKLPDRLRRHYSEDPELLQFAKWLEWHHQAGKQVRKVHYLDL